MRKTNKKIPNFKNYQEEADFWDTHDLADYWDQFKDVDLVVNLQKPKGESLVLRVNKDMKQKLEKVAKNKKVSVSTLSRLWLAERLRAV